MLPRTEFPDPATSRDIFTPNLQKLSPRLGRFLRNKKPCKFRHLHRANTCSSYSASNVTDVPLLWSTAIQRGVKFYETLCFLAQRICDLRRITMGKISGLLFGLIVLIAAVGCGGGSSTPAPTPTPTPSQVFPNDEQLAQVAPVKLGTSGGNANDLGAKVCCIGTLGSLWTAPGITNPVILSNNHVMDRSGNGVAGEAINQPLQVACTPNGAAAPLTVAHLTKGASLKPVANEPGKCGTSKAPLCGHSPSNVDAAIAEIAPGQVDLGGSILDLGPAGATSIAAAAPSNILGVPALGESVGKSGRTTGLTCSTISSISTTVSIDYDAHLWRYHAGFRLLLHRANGN